MYGKRAIHQKQVMKEKEVNVMSFMILTSPDVSGRYRCSINTVFLIEKNIMMDY